MLGGEERERAEGGGEMRVCYITGTSCRTRPSPDRGRALNLITACIDQEESKHRVAEIPFNFKRATASR